MPFRLRRDELRLGELLAGVAAEVVAAAQVLTEQLGEDQGAREDRARQLQEIDYRAEAAAHAVLSALTAAFVTPFDRTDVYRVCWALRMCVARIDAVGDELVLFRFAELPPGTADLVQQVVHAADLTATAVSRLPRPATLVDPWLELSRIAKQGGQAHRRLVAGVTAATKDPAVLAREIAFAQSLWRVIKAFEDVADALQTVAVKES